MTELSNCVVRGAGNAFPPCIFVSGLLVQDTYVEIADMDHKSETSFTTCLSQHRIHAGSQQENQM